MRPKLIQGQMRLITKTGGKHKLAPCRLDCLSKNCHYNNKTVSILHLLILTISPWTKWPPFWQTTYSNAFSWMKMIELQFEFHWNLFPGVQLTISQYWFRWLLGAEQVTSHYLNQCWRSSLTHISGIRGRLVITWHIPKGNWSMVVKM